MSLVRNAGCAILLVACGTDILFGQQDIKETPTINIRMKKDSLETVRRDSQAVAQVPLPEFDIPEYVITGTATIDLPPAERAATDAVTTPFPPVLRAMRSTLRDRSIEGPNERNATYGFQSVYGWNGRAFASIGTFFTPRLEAWVGRSDERYRVDVDAGYGRTKGWVRSSDRTEANGSVAGTYVLSGDSPLIQDAQVDARAGFQSAAYRFFGSMVPDLRREVSRTDVTVGAQSLSNGELPYALRLSINSMKASDSARAVNEGGIRFGVRTLFEALALPWELSFRIDNGNLSGFRRGSQSYFHLEAGTLTDIGPVSLTIAARIMSARSAGSSQLLRFYPHVTASTALDGIHALQLAFAPTLEHRTLAMAVSENPYVSTQTTLRPTDVRQMWTLSLSSNWNSRIQTVGSVEYRHAADAPYSLDTSSLGIWSLAYAPSASIFALNVGAVATLSPNDYFASKFAIRSVRFDQIDSHVPYVPKAELELAYTRSIGSALSIVPRIFGAFSRVADPTGAALPTLWQLDVRAEYRLLPNAVVLLDLSNLLNRSNETWRGYRDRPFSITLGIDVRW